MKIQEVLFSIGQSGYFHVDFTAIRSGRERDGFTYRGPAATWSFTSVVEPAEIVSIVLLLDDGQIAYGDCVDVVYTGVLGRDPIFLPAAHLDVLREVVRCGLVGRDITSFRSLAAEFDALAVDGAPLHAAIRYGVTQALIHAVALRDKISVAEVIGREYELTLSAKPIAILSTGELDEPRHLDRMILKKVDLLPHAYFSNARQQLAPDAARLFEYIRFVAKRIRAIGEASYRPRILVDMCGSLGDLYGDDIVAVADRLGRAAAAAEPFDLLIEGPLTGATFARHLELLNRLRRQLNSIGVNVPIVADEWCNTFDDIKGLIEAEASDYVQIKMPDLGGINNTIETVIYCKENRMGAFLGGSYNETDQSARISTHIALATKPDFMVAKPGMGGDEALMIQRNEMARTLDLVRHRRLAS